MHPGIQNTTTIVTAFFFFAKSKHSLDDYKQWLENFFRYTENPMVIFTSKEMLPLVNNLRTAYSKGMCQSNKNCYATMIITDFNSPWEIPPIKSIKDALMTQLNLDPEKEIHSPDLYAVWNAKAWMLQYVTEQNPFRSRYFLWIDAGAFRTENYRFGRWPNQERAVQIFERDRPHKVLLSLINPFSKEVCTKLQNRMAAYDVEQGPLKLNLIQGGIIGGSSESIRWWSDIYYKTLRIYVRKKWFVGKDQQTMNALALAHPDRINIILTFKLQCGDQWFVFGPLFADRPFVRKNFGNACRLDDLSSAVVPLADACLY